MNDPEVADNLQQGRPVRAARARKALGGGMAGMTSDPAAARVLVAYLPGRAVDDLVRALRQERLSVAAVQVSGDITWPEGAMAAAVVTAAAFDDAARAAVRRLKSAFPRMPVMLQAAHPAAELGAVLGAGYDLWVAQDTPAAAVAAQLAVLCRIVVATQRGPAPEVVKVRDLSVDLERFEVQASGRPVPLTPTEFRIIAHLARRPGRVVSHAELFREVHGYEASEQEAKDILKVHIWRLRNKLTAAGSDGDLIVNVRGFGYLLERRTLAARESAAQA